MSYVSTSSKCHKIFECLVQSACIWIRRITSSSLCLLSMFSFFVLLCGGAQKSFAVVSTSAGPVSFTYQGQVFDLSGNFVTGPVVIKAQVWSEDGTSCLLYEESQSVDLGTAANQGRFAINIGSLVGDPKRTAGVDPGLVMTEIFSSGHQIRASGTNCSSSPGYIPAASGEGRKLRIFVGTDQLQPDEYLDAVPFAQVAQVAQIAESANQLAGLPASQYLQIGSGDLTQANLESIFSNTNYPRLTSLLSVPATNYLQNSANGALGITQVAGQPASGLTAGQMWYDSVGNTLKYYDGTAVKTLASGSSGVTSVTAASTAGNPIVLGGTITAPTIDLPKATTLVDGYLSSADWSTFNSKQAAGNYITVLTGDVTAAGPGSAAATIAANAITTSKINNLAVTDSKINDVGVNKITSSAGNYFTYKPNNTACTNGQILSWDNTNSRWVCANDATSGGTVTAVSSTNADIAVATGTSTPTLTLNTGTTANQIVKLDGTARLPAVDGSQLTNLPSAPVQSVAGRTGTITLSNTDISGLGGAATKNVGTAAGTVAAGDDSRITGALQSSISFSGDVSGAYNATSVDKIKGKAVSATAPTTAGQVLRYDGTNYTPGFVAMTDLRSTVTGTNSFATTCGANQTLTYNSVGDFMSCANIAIANTQVSGLGTASTLNVGTAANNIVQMDGTGKLPAVDASQLTGININNLTGTLGLIGGGTGSTNGSITGSGALTFAAGGTNQNLTLTPSGTGSVVSAGNFSISGVGSFTSGSGAANFNGPVSFINSVSMTSTSPYTQNFLGSSPAAATINANFLTNGSIMNLMSSSSLASTGNIGLNVGVSGTNLSAGVTRTGVYGSVTATGTNSTNIAASFSASGGTNNYGLLVPAGTVGIGVAAPISQLDVRGTTVDVAKFVQTSAANNVGISVQSSANRQSVINLLTDGAPGSTLTSSIPAAGSIGWQIFANGSGYGAGANQFGISYFNNGWLSNQAFSISNNGFVGIGTTNPTAQLDVNGHIGSSAVGTPTVAPAPLNSCGASPPNIVGNDTRGTIHFNVTSPGTACTINFSTPYATGSIPVCVFSHNMAGGSSVITPTISATNMVLNISGAGWNGATISVSYICLQ